ncbi:MAG: GntR family transcriptional regulator [Desulfobacteraceae bacterium]|jgi:DNA-binding GntR family transcriptional regulator|nr:MAG: GntR family transcriptional regulator [Desulfobacteraceae bacterium]
MGPARRPFRETIYKQILRDILEGNINEGEKLLEMELARQFNVSRTPIREALLQLEKDGYIILKKNVGAVVKKTSAKQIQEVIEIIGQLESLAVEIVARRRVSREEVVYLENLQFHMEDNAKAKDYNGYVRNNILFHSFFVEKSDNKTLIDIVSGLRKKIYRLISEGSTLPLHIDEYVVTHRKIMDAVFNNDPQAARREMELHLKDFKTFFLDTMLKRGIRYLDGEPSYINRTLDPFVDF